MPRGVLVVVGGHSRRVGKSSVMEAILREIPELAWHACKISRHRHGAPGGAASAASTAGVQTDRFLRAGAASASLLRLADEALAEGLGPMRRLLENGRNVLAESNRIVRHADPDVVIFAIDPANPDWKKSSWECLARADAVVLARQAPPPAALLRRSRGLPAFCFRDWSETPPGFAAWLRGRLSAGRPSGCLRPRVSAYC